MSDKILHVAVGAITYWGDLHLHLLRYVEGHPDAVAMSLKELMGEEFANIESVQVDVEGDYSNHETIGRKSRRVKEEILKASQEYYDKVHGGDGDDREEHF